MSTSDWLSKVLRADKEFNDPSYIYQFSNGRKFYEYSPFYTRIDAGDFILDVDGDAILDVDGEGIEEV